MSEQHMLPKCDELQVIRLGQNPIIQPLLTDLYEITMAYVYWKSGKMNDIAAFDLFFRKNPFNGEFTIFAGLEECLKFLENFSYSDSDIEYMKSILPQSIEKEFFEYLRNINVQDLIVYAIDEGSVVFPRIPLMRIEGPLILTQLLETTLLNLINYASLITTNAARFRMAAGNNVRLMEFGLRRAQGPDGGLSASKYSYIGGFDSSSNLLAGKLFHIPVAGTHAHSFITSFTGTRDIHLKMLSHRETGQPVDFLELSQRWRERLATLLKMLAFEANEGELAAFISYAIAFPNGFVALIDTYDMRKSGLLNFCSVAMALNDLQYKAIGIRIDSGDLAYLSNFSHKHFATIAETFDIPWFRDLLIIVSNDINEDTILSLNDQDHRIGGFGVGTHLVTCQRQPALGCVYKMVEVNGCPRIKISQDFDKVTMPGRKQAFRLYGSEGCALVDLMQRVIEQEPEAGKKILCRHPFERSKRCYVIPTKVERLHRVYWKDGKIALPLPTLDEIKKKVQASLQTLRPDVKRNLNPTPYKISISEKLYNFIQDLWLENAPIGELT